MWIKFRQYMESVDPWMPKQDSVWKLMEGISGSKVMKYSQTTAIFSFSLFMDEWNKGQRQILFSEWMKKLTKARDKVGQRAIKCRRESGVVDLEKYERKLGWEIYSATLIPFLLLLLLISFFFFTVFLSMICREQEDFGPWGIFSSQYGNCDHRCIYKSHISQNVIHAVRV